MRVKGIQMLLEKGLCPQVLLFPLILMVLDPYYVSLPVSDGLTLHVESCPDTWLGLAVYDKCH